jgi:DNA-binding response OmpR family regulator
MGLAPSIVYVEDEPELRLLLAEALECEGFNVDTFRTAEAALEAIAGRHYDVLITDYRLPEENGDWLLHEAAKRGYLDRTNVIVLTAETHPPGIHGVRVLHKSIDFDGLVLAIRAELPASGAGRSL